jgi:hypothetical protein
MDEVADIRGICRREDMADMSAIGEMLSGLRRAIETVKFLEEHTSPTQKEDGSKFTELVQLLGAIRGQLLEAQTMFEVSELEKNLQVTSTLVKFHDAYYEVDEHNHPTGEAYCMHCWETNGLKRHLHRWYENDRVNICSLCETKYLVGRTTFTYRGGL